MQYPVLAIIIPLLGSLLAVIGAWTRRSTGIAVALFALALSVGFSALLFVQTLDVGTVTYRMGGWEPPWGIVLVVDSFSALMLCLVSFAALANLFASRKDIEHDMPEKTPAMLGLYLLTTAGHMGIVATGDVFNLFVFIEVSALSGYALLSLGGPRAAMASLSYLFIGSAGASLYLLGVGYLYIQSGSLNMIDIASIMKADPTSATLLAGFVILVLGITVKMALFPFHSWVPKAYGSAAMPSASLLAPLTTKVMAYVLVRMLLSVFPAATLADLTLFTDGLVWIATIGIIAGAAMALTQTDIRRMLCFILVAEVGYMAGGIFMGNETAMTGAMLHILADLAMTLTLFMALGNIVARRGGQGVDKADGLFANMPVTMAAFVIGALSMIGVPPLCGFYSKWYLISGAMEAGQYQFAVALILSSLVNVVLFFRILERAFFRKSEVKGYSDVGWSRLLPLGLVAVSLPLIGLLTGGIVKHVITPAIAAMS
jgi:multicomponent Na+:H+ antiporter subunit D